MGARVSEPMVVVERIREGLFCCTWRMPPSSSGTLLKDDKCYVNTLQLHNEQQYSIAISWLPDNKFTLVVELQSSASVGEPQKEVPQVPDLHSQLIRFPDRAIFHYAVDVDQLWGWPESNDGANLAWEDLEDHGFQVRTGWIIPKILVDERGQ